MKNSHCFLSPPPPPPSSFPVSLLCLAVITCIDACAIVHTLVQNTRTLVHKSTPFCGNAHTHKLRTCTHAFINARMPSYCTSVFRTANEHHFSRPRVIPYFPASMSLQYVFMSFAFLPLQQQVQELERMSSAPVPYEGVSQVNSKQVSVVVCSLFFHVTGV